MEGTHGPNGNIQLFAFTEKDRTAEKWKVHFFHSTVSRREGGILHYGYAW